MNKYHNGKIYKIVDIGYNKCYIGSKTESLSMRMARHRSQYKKREGMIGKVCSFNLFDMYGIENCKIELIEKFSCETKEELLKREGQYIQSLDCINKNVAGRTKQDWYSDNKGYCNEKTKQYRRENTEKIKELNQKYRAKHQAELVNKSREYYKENKEDLLNKYKAKTRCSCGSIIRSSDIRRHERSNKHQTYQRTLKQD